MLFGIFGLVAGSYIGGNYGFFEFGGNVGYEAGGAFFGILGISLGSLLAIMIVKKLQKTKYNLVYGLIAAIITALAGTLLFDYYMPVVIGFTILLLPPTALTLTANWQIKSPGR